MAETKAEARDADRIQAIVRRQTGRYVIMTCAMCGIKYTVDTAQTGWHQRRYCSQGCTRAAANAQKRDHYHRCKQLSQAACAKNERAKRQKERDAEYERWGGVQVVITTRDGVRIETRGRPCWGGNCKW